MFTKIVLIPGGPDCAYDAPAAALTGRLDPTPDVAAVGAWIEARWGWRSRRPWRPTAVVRAAAMSCVATVSLANKASHVDPARVERQGSGGSRNAGRAQNRRARVPKGNPRDREVPESPQGSPGGLRRPPGAATSGPRVAGVGTRVPSHLRGVLPRGGRRVPEARPLAALATQEKHMHDDITRMPGTIPAR